jgi:hypothetical protein
MAEAEAAPMELDTVQTDTAAAEAQDAPEAAEQPKEQYEKAKGKQTKQEPAKHDADDEKDDSSPQQQKKQPLLHVTVVEGKRERKKVRDCCYYCCCPVCNCGAARGISLCCMCVFLNVCKTQLFQLRH